MQKGKAVKEDKYRLACATGVLKTLYTRSYIHALEIDPGLMGLQDALDGWRDLPEVGLREAMRVVSVVGGQGLVCTAAARATARRSGAHASRISASATRAATRATKFARTTIESNRDGLAGCASLQMSFQSADELQTSCTILQTVPVGKRYIARRP